MKNGTKELLVQSLDDPDADFRDGQWECIEKVLKRERVLVVQRTGWGKSMVYFLATRVLRDQGAGATLLISPLLALMRNQIRAAERIGVRAATINSSNRDDWEAVQKQLLAGKVDILLISPERLANDAFREEVLLPIAHRVGLFVVDEATASRTGDMIFGQTTGELCGCSMRFLQISPCWLPLLQQTIEW